MWPEGILGRGRYSFPGRSDLEKRFGLLATTETDRSSTVKQLCVSAHDPSGLYFARTAARFCCCFRTGRLSYQIFHILRLVDQDSQLLRQRFYFCFSTPVDIEIQLAPQTILYVLAVLTHHDHRRLNGGQHGQEQIHQNEWIRIPRMVLERRVHPGIHHKNNGKRDDERPRAAKARY